MRTKQILTNATAANAADALRFARERNWSDESILRHAPLCVQQLIIKPVTLAQPLALVPAIDTVCRTTKHDVESLAIMARHGVAPTPKAPFREWARTGLNNAPARKAPEPKRAPEPTEVLNQMWVTLTHTDGKTFNAKLTVFRPRKKVRGTGETFPVLLNTAAQSKKFTLSPAALERLVNGDGTRAGWLDDRMYLITLRK